MLISERFSQAPSGFQCVPFISIRVCAYFYLENIWKVFLLLLFCENVALNTYLLTELERS
jgi:hypothetical protein